MKQFRKSNFFKSFKSETFFLLTNCERFKNEIIFINTLNHFK